MGHLGALPAEFVKCVSAEEVRARLASGRPFSALLADAALPAVDRDLISAARAAGCAALVVDDGRARRDWPALEVAAVLTPDFARKALLGALVAHAPKIRRGDAAHADLPLTSSPAPGVELPGRRPHRCRRPACPPPPSPSPKRLADDVRNAGPVLLADLRLHAEHAMLHDARDVVPGVQELVEAHRAGEPSADAERALTFAVAERGYHLLLGLRQARHWPAIGPAPSRPPSPPSSGPTG